MRISAKTRYGLSALLCLARSENPTKRTTVLNLSENLNISKIYLEQVFVLLKQAGLVSATKGAQGGYLLSRPPKEISVYDVFAAIEPALLEKTQSTVADSNEPNIEAAMHNIVFGPLDDAVREFLAGITLEDLVENINAINSDGYMFYL